MTNFITKLALAISMIAPVAINAEAAAPDNTAHEWTKACHAEFGPKATHPDAKLLEKCINFGSQQSSAAGAASKTTKLNTQQNGTTAKRDNVAHAWTVACKKEFGPKATHPDAKLLELCLNY